MAEIKNCPYCGEEVLAVAKKCKHCGQWLQKQCPHCHKWIKVTAQKCRYCKQWVEEQETVYYEDKENNSFFSGIFEFIKDGCLNLLAYAFAIIVICVIAEVLQPSKSDHIEIAKTKLAESAWLEFAKQNTRQGELVNCYGYLVPFDDNFVENVKEVYESRYEFKVYDLIVISFCDVIDKKTKVDSTVTLSAFGLVVLIAKPTIIRY